MLIIQTLIFLSVLSASTFFFRFNPWFRAFLYILGLFAILLTALETISDRLTGMGFNDAVVFHLQYGLEGAGFEKFIPLTIISCLSLLSLVAVWTMGVFHTSNGSLSTKTTYLVITSLALISILFHPTLHSIYRLTFPHRSELPVVQFYLKPTIEETPFKLPNIVWIYGESLERTYMDENTFPGLTPNLKRLEDESLSFADIDQIGSSGWTIAGLVSSQCGIPLVVTGGHGNSMDTMPTFLPAATCLGDLLKSSSYSLTFMGGADPMFAGKGKFLKTHGFAEVFGKNELTPLLSDPNYQSDWGLYDDTLLSFGLDKFKSLLAQKKPFGLFLLTLDTHHPTGYLSKSCEGLKYKDGSNAILNSVHCADKLIAETVREITKLDENTLIVVSSDHLAMNNTAHEQLEKQPRKNLLIYHWPGKIKPRVSNKLGSTYSSGATALDLMGFGINGIGLGRSLVSDKPTLREAIPNVKEAVNGWDHEFRKLWNIPENPKSIHVDPNRKFVSFSGSIYKIPVIVDISKSEKFPRLIYDNNEAPLSSIITTLGPETRSIWLDSCERIFGVIRQDQAGDALETCIWDDKLREITKVDSSIEYAINN